MKLGIQVNQPLRDLQYGEFAGLSGPDHPLLVVGCSGCLHLGVLFPPAVVGHATEDSY